MKKKLILLLPISFFLCSCSLADINIFGWKPFASNESKENEKPGADDVKPDDEGKHATSITLDPSAPFTLKVGESRELSISFDQTPTDKNEQIFTWELTGDAVEYTVNETNTRKATVTGKKAGSASLLVTNTYNHQLSKSFSMKVIEFDENRDYMWQYDSSDRASFGYVYKDNPAGNPSGTAKLNGMDWAFRRTHEVNGEEVDYVSSLQSSMGAIGFGKGDDPETHVHLETENTRTVDGIIIETASANSLAKMTVKVGDTVYMNEKTVPAPENKVITGVLSNDEVTPTSGKITIDVYTPEFDAAQKEADESYRAPGAFYLKSILIHFSESLPDKTMSLVKSADDIVADGRYIILGTSSAGFGLLDGSLGSSVADNPYFLEDFTVEDTKTVSANFDKYGFVASLDENNKLNFTSDKDIKIGLNNSGGLSVTKSPKILGWDYSVDDDNFLHMSMVDPSDSSKNKYFGANSKTGKFSAYASVQNNIYLYKFN